MQIDQAYPLGSEKNLSHLTKELQSECDNLAILIGRYDRSEGTETDDLEKASARLKTRIRQIEDALEFEAHRRRYTQE